MFEYVFDDVSWLPLLAILPVVWILFAVKVSWMHRAQKRFATVRMMGFLAPSSSVSKIVLKYFIYTFVLVALVMALVNPKIGIATEQVRREGVDIVFALDVSRSMLAEDIAPSRLEKAKQLISRTLDELGGDRVGIIAYAGSAFPLLPITTDYAAAKMYLQNANTDMVSSQGTSIAQAVGLTGRYFDDASRTGRYLFIISDGEDHGQGAEAAAKAVAEKGVQVYAIGVGTSQGGPIPIKQNGRPVGFKKDGQDNVVITKADAATLEAIAAAGGGKYIDGTSTREVVDQIRSIVKKGEKSEAQTMTVTRYRDRFTWFLGAALLLLALDVLVSYRRSGIFEKMNLFDTKQDDE